MCARDRERGGEKWSLLFFNFIYANSKEKKMFATKRQGILKETKSLQNPKKDGVISKQIMQLAAIELTIFPP